MDIEFSFSLFFLWGKDFFPSYSIQCFHKLEISNILNSNKLSSRVICRFLMFFLCAVFSFMLLCSVNPGNLNHFNYPGFSSVSPAYEDCKGTHSWCMACKFLNGLIWDSYRIKNFPPFLSWITLFHYFMFTLLKEVVSNILFTLVVSGRRINMIHTTLSSLEAEVIS